jgi:crotonobetainyl-CoA:carnitine CoA-transferase CaiB-like acyl-CoA transferase
LRHRDVSGEGQRIDVPMFENLSTIVLGEHLAGSLFEPAIGEPGYQRSLAHNRRPHRTRDGYICTLVYTDKHWRSFFAVIGQPEMFEKDGRFSSQNERLKHIDEVYGYLAGVLATRMTSEWIDVLTEADIPVARMNSLTDVLNDEHLNAINYFQIFDHPSEGLIKDVAIPTEWSASKPELSRHAPSLGEHTIEVLREAGLDARTIAELLKTKVVVCAKDPVSKEDCHG